MSSIRFCVGWLVGCGVGLLVIARYPAGLDGRYAVTVGMLGLACASCFMAAHRAGDRALTGSTALVAALLFGVCRALLIHAPVTAADLAYYNTPAQAPAVRLTGTVSAEPLFSDRSQRLRISVDSIRPAGVNVARRVRGDLLAVVARYPEYSVGERLVLSGTLTAPPSIGTFDYASYLSRSGIYSYLAFPHVTRLGQSDMEQLSSIVSGARERVGEVINQSLPEPQASLAIGVVTGDRSTIPQDVLDAFQQSGTSHILAISGENIALLVGLAWVIVRRPGRARMGAWALALLLAFVGVYAIFTGATASVLRSALMSGLLLIAPQVGRRYDPVAALAVSAFAMTLVDPDVLFDGGFQLSFAAMLGIALVSPHLWEVFSRLRLPVWLNAPLSAGLGAQALTVPLVAVMMGRVSLVSPLATLFADVALLPLMVCGILLGVLGSLWGPLASLLGPPAWLCGSWMLGWVRFWASLPGASVGTTWVDLRWVCVYYAVVLLGLWAASRRRRRKRSRPVVTVAV